MRTFSFLLSFVYSIIAQAQNPFWFTNYPNQFYDRFSFSPYSFLYDEYTLAWQYPLLGDSIKAITWRICTNKWKGYSKCKPTVSSCLYEQLVLCELDTQKKPIKYIALIADGQLKKKECVVVYHWLFQIDYFSRNSPVQVTKYRTRFFPKYKSRKKQKKWNLVTAISLIQTKQDKPIKTTCLWSPLQTIPTTYIEYPNSLDSSFYIEKMFYGNTKKPYAIFVYKNNRLEERYYLEMNLANAGKYPYPQRIIYHYDSIGFLQKVITTSFCSHSKDKRDSIAFEQLINKTTDISNLNITLDSLSGEQATQSCYNFIYTKNEEGWWAASVYSDSYQKEELFQILMFPRKELHNLKTLNKKK